MDHNDNKTVVTNDTGILVRRYTKAKTNVVIAYTQGEHTFSIQTEGETDMEDDKEQEDKEQQQSPSLERTLTETGSTDNDSSLDSTLTQGHIEDDNNNKTFDVTINYSELNHKKSKTDNVCAPFGFVQVQVDGKKKKRKTGKASNALPLNWSSDDDFV